MKEFPVNHGKKGHRGVRAVITLLLLLSCVQAVFSDEEPPQKINHRIFRLSHQRAGDVEKLIAIFLSPEGVTVSDERTNTLVVKDYPAVLGRIEEFIVQMDRPLPQVQIAVNFLDSASFSTSGWGLSASGVNGQWMVALGGGSAGGSSRAAASMRLVTISGTWADISCGERVIYSDWFIAYARNGGYLAESLSVCDVSTGFSVMPRVCGEDVEITIAPYISCFADASKRVIRFDRAAATVRVANGQSAILAAGNNEQSTIIRKIFGTLDSRSSGSYAIGVTPVIIHR